MKEKNKRGNFIVIEGPDGAGKTKAIEFVKKELDSMGISVVFTREPGGTLVADKIRAILQDKENRGMSVMCDLLLYSASRADHVDKVIKPSLESGEIIICDRYYGSTVAYQVYARGREGYESAFNTITRFAIDGCVPDMWILLDVDSEVAMERNRKDGNKNSRFDLEKVEFHKRVREGYYKFFNKHARGRPHRIIDTTELSENEAGKLVLESILAFLKDE